MRSFVRARSSVVAVLSLVVSGSALAQIPGLPQFALDRLEVDSSAMGSLVVGTGEILPVGAVRFSLAGDYANKYQYTDSTGAVVPFISDRYTVHLVGGFAPMDWLEIGLDVPVVAAQRPGQGIDVDFPGLGVVSRALGSPTLSARGGLMFQSKGAPFDMAFQLGAKIPIDSEAFASDPKIALSPKLMFGRNLDWARAGVELGALWRPTTTTVSSSGDPVLDTVGSSLLVAGVLSAGQQNGLRGEISGRTYVTLGGKVGAVELLLGARYPVAPNMELYALAGPGLGQAAGTPQWRVMVGAAFGNGQGITGTPLPGEGALQPMPGAAGAPQQPGTAPQPAPAPAETQPQPSNPFPPFTPPPGMYPPQQPAPTYPQPTPAYPPPPPPDSTYSTPPQPPPPAPTYAPPPPSQPAPPPPPAEPAPSSGYNTYPTGN